MQPECDNESHLATHLGIIARNGEQVPLIYAQWTDVPNDVKDYVWKEVQDNTDAPPEYRSNCLKSVGYLWRRWKSYVKTNYYDIWDTDEDRLAHAPNRVVREQWETLIDYWGTAKRQEISAKNKKNRLMQELNHRTGRTPFAVIRRKMKKAGEKTDRISVLKKTRTPKGGGPLNPDTAAVIAEMEEQRDAVPEEEQTPEFLDNVFTQVVGPDGHGRVRTYGSGPTPTTIFGKVMGASSLELMQKKIREEVRAEFQSQFDVMFNSSLAAIRDSIRAELLADLHKDREMSGRNGQSSIGQVHTSASVHLPDDDRQDEYLGREDRGEYMHEEE